MAILRRSGAGGAGLGASWIVGAPIIAAPVVNIVTSPNVSALILPDNAPTTLSGDGSSTGLATVTGTGAETAASDGSATGVATVTATSSEIAAAAGSSAGSATVTSVGAAGEASSGSAAGSGTASGVGAEIAAASGTATGSGTATAGGAETSAAVGSSTAAGSASAVGASIEAAAGSAVGTGIVSGIGASTAATVGSAAGSGAATAASPTITVTWNPSDKDANVTLSGGNLTATLTAAVNDRAVRATLSQASGYFETTVGVSGYTSGGPAMTVGLANTSQSLSTWIGADGTNGISYGANGFVFGTGGSSFGIIANTGIGYGAGDKIGWELFASTAKVYKNGVLIYTFTALPTGSLYPALSLGDQNEAATADFGASAFSYFPVGETSWDRSRAGITGAGSAGGSASVTAVGAKRASAAGTASGAGSAFGVSPPVIVVVSGTGVAAGSSSSTAVGKATIVPVVHVGKWHVADPTEAAIVQGAFDDGFADGFDTDAAEKLWQVTTAKPQLATPWKAVNPALSIPLGDYSDGFADGFDIGGAEKAWKVVNAKPQFTTQGSFSKDFSADFEVGVAGGVQKWRIVTGSVPPLGAFDDGFSDGFETDSVAEKIWKIAA